MQFNLTPKQISFVENLSEGFNASDAYRAAYNASEMSDKTIWEASSRLSKNPKVVARLDLLSAEIKQVNRESLLSIFPQHLSGTLGRSDLLNDNATFLNFKSTLN